MIKLNSQEKDEKIMHFLVYTITQFHPRKEFYSLALL